MTLASSNLQNPGPPPELLPTGDFLPQWYLHLSVMSCLHHVPSPQGIHSLCLVSYREFNNLSLMKKSSYFSGDGHMLGLFRVGYEGAVALIPGIQGA